MSDSDPDEARDRVVDAIARSSEVYGLNRSYGRLYGILFFADEALSMDELVAESGYAKSTVSSRMKDLQRLHFVTRTSKPGEGKRAYFEAETDFRYVFRQILEQEGRREISIMLRALREAREMLDEAPETERTERYRDRIQYLEDVYEKSDRLLSLYLRLPESRLSALFDKFAEWARSGD